MPSAATPPPTPVPSRPGLPRPRIGVGGIAIECSTFCPRPTTTADFTVRRGEQAVAHLGLRGAGPQAAACDWVGLTVARALPGGPVAATDYRTLRADLVEAVRAAGPLDGLLLMIHGAMAVCGMDDAEADLAGAVRAALGPEALVFAPMDLHGSVGAELLEHLDLATCYRTAPHVDEAATVLRTAEALAARLRGPGGADVLRRRPSMAWVPVPVLLPGEKTSTRAEPARSLYRAVAEAAAAPGVLDVGLWVGYAWADEPRSRAGVVVAADDEALAGRLAGELAAAYWAAREEFDFVAPTAALEVCLDRAFAHAVARPGRPGGRRGPYVVSDTGDNPTAGGAGDVTWTLGELLARPEVDGRHVVHASTVAPRAVDAARRAGVGGRVEVLLGGTGTADTVAHGPGASDSREPGGTGAPDPCPGEGCAPASSPGAASAPDPYPPVRLTGTVHSLTADPVGGTIAVVRSGGLWAVLTERRKPYHRRVDFISIGLDPAQAQVLVVKIGYLEPELFDLAADWSMALTPGAVDQDLSHLAFTRLRRPIHPLDPFDADAPLPGAAPRFVGGRHAR